MNIKIKLKNKVLKHNMWHWKFCVKVKMEENGDHVQGSH